MKELPIVREAFGFQRTECACGFCQVHCRHVPGTLGPADLTRLCSPEQDVFRWAERHLRALDDRPYPTLVPARQDNGHCHWYLDGKCLVHANAPYSCAFFDSHMDEREIARRVAATIEAIRRDAAADGLYYRVWLHLRRQGLLGRRGDRAALMADMHRLRRRVEEALHRMG